MTLPHGESMWGLAFGIIALLFFLGIGIAHIVYPDHFMDRSATRRGGKMLSRVNRDGFRLLGVVSVIFSAGVIFVVIKDILTK